MSLHNFMKLIQNSGYETYSEFYLRNSFRVLVAKLIQSSGCETHSEFWLRNLFRVLVTKLIQSSGYEAHSEFWLRNSFRVLVTKHIQNSGYEAHSKFQLSNLFEIILVHQLNDEITQAEISFIKLQQTSDVQVCSVVIVTCFCPITVFGQWLWRQLSSYGDAAIATSQC